MDLQVGWPSADPGTYRRYYGFVTQFVICSRASSEWLVSRPMLPLETYRNHLSADEKQHHKGALANIFVSMDLRLN